MGRNKLKKSSFNTQPQLTRYYTLVKRIQRGDYPSQKVLAQELEKTTRTIQRDLDYIRDFWNLPLAYDPYRYGYYFSGPLENFPTIPISEGELVSVFIAQKALGIYHGTPFEAPVRSAFQKLTASLTGEISVSWADLDSAISFRGIEADVGDVEVLAKLGEAVRKKREVEFVYYKLPEIENSKLQNSNFPDRQRRDLGGSETSKSKHRNPGNKGEDQPVAGAGREPVAGSSRRVRPYHLGLVGGQWYLFAYDPMRSDMRRFVPARMRDVRVTETEFERPKDFSIEKLLKGSFGVFSGDRQTREVRVRFDAFAGRLVKERKWHHSQKLRELKDGGVEVTMELTSYVEVVQWILGWGRRARVIAPKDLVREVKEEAKAVAEAYG